MRAPRRHHQPDLFIPRPILPNWAELPPEVRAKALTLLARLLRATHDRRPVAAADKGVRHE
jgi:hypothetical protein